MNVVDILLDNYTMLFELVGLMVILFISVHISDYLKKNTRIVVLLLLFASIVYYLELWTQSFESYTPWRGVLSAIKYSSYPTILYIIITRITSLGAKLNFKQRIILSIPLMIAIPLFFSVLYSGVVFYYTEDNHYQGGPLGKLPYIVFGFYWVIFIVLNVIYLRYYKVRDRIIALFITISAALYVVLNLIFEKDTDYVKMFTSTLVFYFLFIYIHSASIDSLTGLLNRQSFYQDIKVKSDRIKSVISVDMNELKYINDTFGHAKGDEALVTISKILLTNAGVHRAVYRIGGDEFIMLFSISDEEEIKRRIENMRIALEKASYSCAFGYAMKTDEDISDVLKKADENMYIDKKMMKQRCLDEGGEVHQRL